jgi:hypothetical protein
MQHHEQQEDMSLKGSKKGVPPVQALLMWWAPQARSDSYHATQSSNEDSGTGMVVS